jgi:uncharacterized protein YecE (DUF72 family)
MPDIRIGISGYNYPRWRGDFYPDALRLKDWLRFASRMLNSIELNGTFYSLKSPEVFSRWREETPDGFLFAIKGSRFITHNLKLRRAEGALANFFASGVLALERKTGPFLWQLPATYSYDRGRMETYFRLLPRDSVSAARLAEHHDDRLRRGALTTSETRIPYRHAFEVRHPSYFTDEFYSLLRDHDIGFVIADTADTFPYAEEVTSAYVYVRLHGSRQLYASGYTDEELDRWSERIGRWRDEGRDTYVYFDNDARGHAPHDARRLAARLGCAPDVSEAMMLADAPRSMSRSAARGSSSRSAGG